MRFRLGAVVVLCLLVIAASSFSGCSSTADDVSAVPVLVVPQEEKLTTDVAAKGSISKLAIARGSIAPVGVVGAYFKNQSGYLKEIYVNLGDDVKKGDILAALDDSDVKYSISQEEIKLKLAQLSYDQAVKNNSSEYDIQRAALLLDSEKLAMEKLQKSLEGTLLKAEISGRIVDRAEVQISQYINGNLMIVAIADPAKYVVECNTVNASDFLLGTEVTIIASNKQNKGVVVENTSQTDDPKVTNRNLIKVKFIDPPKDVKLGDIAEIRCSVAQKDNVIIVPQKAVKFGEGSHPYVRVMQNGDILEKYINTGISDGDRVEVTNGLSEGETVLLN